MNDLQIHALDMLLDDHFALWDFGDSFPVFKPSASESKIEELIELADRGLVLVTYGRWFENDTKPVASEKAVTVLRDPKVWMPTGKKPGYALELTELGRSQLHALGIWSGSTN